MAVFYVRPSEAGRSMKSGKFQFSLMDIFGTICLLSGFFVLLCVQGILFGTGYED